MLAALQPLALVLLGMAMGFLAALYLKPATQGNPMPLYPELQTAVDDLNAAVAGLPAKEQAKIDAAVATALEGVSQDKADTIAEVSTTMQSATDALNNA